jgi:hypothetical protein
MTTKNVKKEDLKVGLNSMDKNINRIREILFKYLDIQRVPDIMNDIRDLFNKPDNDSIPVELLVSPKVAKETENILLSELISHLRANFDDGEVISYRIKVKQPFSTREIRYPIK